MLESLTAKMKSSTFYVIAMLLAVAAYKASCLQNALSIDEINKFTNILQAHRPKNLEAAFHAVKALKALGKEVPAAEEVCSFAESNLEQNVKSAFQYSEIVKALKCKSALKSVDGVDESDAKSVSYAIAASVNLGLKVQDSLVKSLEKALKNDDSPASAANAFYAGSLLPKETNLKFLTDLVEDIVAQADEIDGALLKFEGGLGLTSAVVRGALALADGQNKASSLTEEQVSKFARYFLERKYVMDVKSIFDLTSALSQLAKNKFQVPVLVSVFKSDRLTEKNRIFKVRVTDVLDNSIADVKVTAKSVTSASGDTVAENVALVKGPEDDYIVVRSDIGNGYIAAHTHVYDFSTTDRGIYTLSLNIEFKKNAKIYIGGKDVEVKAKVVSRVNVGDVEVGVADRDQAASPKSIKVTFPDKIKSNLEADYHQKIIMKFALKDSAGGLTTVHQAFVRLTHIATGQEIFFVAQSENDVYKFTLDLGTTGKDSFNNLSGKYKMDLLVGDALVQIPIKWNIATVSLTFAEEPKKSKKQMRIVGAQPVIEHMFRVPEKRPPVIMSNIFTALIGIPLLVMFIAWIKIGANVSNFEFSIPSLMFHLGLGCIFVLYYLFWIKLNMFTTLKALILIGGITFLGGNKMLAAMAARKQNRS